MHTLVRRYVKTAIAFLVAGLALGAWMLVRRELWGRFPTAYETSAHTHAIARRCEAFGVFGEHAGIRVCEKQPSEHIA